MYWHPKKHPRMSFEARAAQFAPFAALNGHEEALAETARLTSEQEQLDDDEMRYLESCLLLLAEHIADRPEVAVTYFVSDELKAGGAYLTHHGTVRRIEPSEGVIIFHDGLKIAIPSIRAIEGTLFAGLSW